MFTIKELNQLRKYLDYSTIYDSVNLDNDQANDFVIQHLRNKICDLITLHKAWNKGNSIEESICSI